MAVWHLQVNRDTEIVCEHSTVILRNKGGNTVVLHFDGRDPHDPAERLIDRVRQVRVHNRTERGKP